MRPIAYYRDVVIPGTKPVQFKEVEEGQGMFHCFSVESDGTETIPVAIIEKPDGQVITWTAYKCKFIDKEDNNAE